MKQFLFVAITVLALFSSCQREPKVSVSVKDALTRENVVSASGDTVTVDVTSEGEWRTSSTDTAITVNPSSGSGDMSVTIIVSANTSGVDRNMTVTFYSVLGTSNEPVEIKQRAPSVSVSLVDEQEQQKEKEVSALGGIFYVDVESDGGWIASADDSVIVNPSYFSGTAKRVKVTVLANATNNERNRSITFYSALNSSVSDNVTIHQKSVNFSVDPAAADIAAAGGTLCFTINADGGWDTFAGGGATVNPSSGTGPGSVSVEVPGNTESTARDVKVIFYSSTQASLSDTVTIHQKAPSVSVEKQSADEVAATGGSVTVDITSDGGFIVPESAGFEAAPSEWKDSGSKQVTIEVNPNTTGVERNVKVIFRSRLNSSISETVSIRQKSMSISVTSEVSDVATAGGEFTCTVTADGEWTASSDTDGVTVTPSGDSKSAIVKVPVNATGLLREVKVKFWLTQNTSIADSVIVTQESISVSVPRSDTTVSVSGGTFDVQVTSDTDWSAYIGVWRDSKNKELDKKYEKVTLSPSSGSGNGTVKVTVPANTAGEERKMNVTFRCTRNINIAKTLTIRQKASEESGQQ